MLEKSLPNAYTEILAPCLTAVHILLQKKQCTRLIFLVKEKRLNHFPLKTFSSFPGMCSAVSYVPANKDLSVL